MELLKSETLLGGAYVDLLRRTYRRADGSEVTRDVIHHPGSAVVLAHDEEAVYLVAQPREAVEEDRSLELPAGTLDVEGESPLECARRELAEEAGLRAERWSVLQVIHPSLGFLDEEVTIFEATGLAPADGEHAQDHEEQIEVIRLPLTDIPALLPDLRSASTIVGLLMLVTRPALGAGAR
jgi:8-oxo-dGDP phosphatase